MLNCNSSLSESENFDAWKDIDQSQIELKKLAGLTNKTYSAKIVDPSVIVEPQIVIFREFGQIEGFVDKALENFIFKEIGRLGLGPIEYAQGNNWRLEEYITEAVHPTTEKQNEAGYQFSVMGLAQNFHSLDMPIENKESSNILNNVFSEDLKISILSKMAMEGIFSEKDLSVIKEIRDLVEDDTQFQQMKQFVEHDPQDEFIETKTFCHNDLNQLNIFITPKPNREIVFIDYDYCGQNYPSYDIANFLNEQQINYQYTEEPYYCHSKSNEQTSVSLHFIVLCYIIHQIINEQCTLKVRQSTLQAINQLITLYPNANKDRKQLNSFQQESETVFINIFDQNIITYLRKKIKFLKKRVSQFQIISNYNWILWSVKEAKKLNSDFDHIDYAQLRYQMYNTQLKTYMRKMGRNKLNYDENDSDSYKSKDQTASSGSDSDEQI